jgi:hypothetical protein
MWGIAVQDLQREGTGRALVLAMNMEEKETDLARPGQNCRVPSSFSALARANTRAAIKKTHALSVQPAPPAAQADPAHPRRARSLRLLAWSPQPSPLRLASSRPSRCAVGRPGAGETRPWRSLRTAGRRVERWENHRFPIPSPPT